MNEDLKEVYVKQMLLPKEELALQTMELMADKMILEDNWNKLKEWLEEEYERCDKIGSPAIGCAMGQIKRIKSKMQEIEGETNEGRNKNYF